MIERSSLLVLVAGAALLAVSACGGGAEKGKAQEEPAPAAESQMAPAPVAIAELAPVGGSNVHGRVVFTQKGDSVEIEADVTGLAPGKHGFHIHQWGDCSSPDGKSAGGHFNPEGVPHAGPDAPQAHAGDLGNIEADATGHGTVKMTSSRISLTGGPNDIRGRAVILHAGEDDLHSQPTGAAGARVACGVVKEEGAETAPVLPPQ